MSDDAPRSAQGNRPDQRRGRGAPVWWDMLQRSDLPDDPDALDMVTRVRGWDTSAPRTRRARDDAPHRSRLAIAVSIISAVLVALSIAIAVWVATSTTQHSSGLTLAVIVAVPVVLITVSVLTSFAGRRRR
jgi:hypothetical protein